MSRKSLPLKTMRWALEGIEYDDAPPIPTVDELAKNLE